MKQNTIQASFQLQDSFVKDFNIHVLEKFDKQSELNIAGQLGFRVINIRKEKENYIGEIELINDLKISLQKKEKATIHISMIGLFVESGKTTKDKFEQMLKVNGATTISHLIRAYVYSATGLAGIPQITTPMMNFVEFFENAKKEENENKTSKN